MCSSSEWKFEPPSLDVDEVRERVVGLQQHLDFFETVVDARMDGAVIKFVYEDLYFASPEQRNEQIDAMGTMLRLPPLDHASYQHFLRPEDAKINGATTYAWLPNAEELDRECGNDVTGWLLG